MSVITRKPGGRLRSRRLAPVAGRLLCVCVAAVNLGGAATFPVTFHRLRIEYSTTSDWTTLDLENPEGILTVRAMEVKGAPTNSDARADRLALNQPLGAAQAGGEVGMTVDCALAPEALDRPLAFLLKKGDLNASTVRVLHVGEDGARLLGEAVHRGVVPQSGGRSTCAFLRGCKRSPPCRWCS